MNRPPLQATLIKALTGFFQASKLSRWQIAWLSLGLIGLLYTALLIGLARPADVAHSPDNATAAAQTISAPTPLPDLNSTADDALSDTFLSEYQRLSGQSAALETTTVAEPATPVDNGSWAGTLTFSLLVVVGLAYAGIWGFKQLTLRSGGAALGLGSKQLTIQETQVLGPHQKLHLVRLGQEMLLIGATDQTITCLARYDAEQMAETFDEHLQVALRPQTSNQPVPLQESLEALRKVQHRGRGGDDA